MKTPLSTSGNANRKRLIMEGKPFTFVGMISTFKFDLSTCELLYLEKGEWLPYAIVNVFGKESIKFTRLDSIPRFKEGHFDFIDIRW